MTALRAVIGKHIADDGPEGRHRLWSPEASSSSFVIQLRGPGWAAGYLNRGPVQIATGFRQPVRILRGSSGEL
jgi:hypothetical protein